MQIDELVALFQRASIPATSVEKELQESVESLLKSAGVEFRPQVRLSSGGIVDVMVGSIAVELKVKGVSGAILRQIAGYAECEEVSGVVVVTTRQKHRIAVDTLYGKPVSVVRVGGYF